MKTILILISLFFSYTSFSQTTIEMEKKGGIYTIPCEVNGLPMTFIFDTGASDVVLSLVEALFMFKQGLLSINDIVGKTEAQVADGSIISGTKVNLRKIQIEDIIIENIEATIIDTDNAPLLLGQTAINKLGKYSIKDNILILENGNKDFKDSIDYETMELNSSNLLYISKTNIQKQGWHEIESYLENIKKIDSLINDLKLNNPKTSMELASIYYNTTGLLPDNNRALNKEEKKLVERLHREYIFYLEKAFKQGEISASHRLGLYYSMVKQDCDLAIKWYEMGYEKGSAECAFGASRCYTKNIGLNIPKYELEWMEKAANKGYETAISEIGYFYLNGKGTEKNIMTAISWFEKAEKYAEIGDIYFYGDGLKKDYDIALKWYNKGLVYDKLGDMHYYGLGMPKNFERAAFYYELTIDKNKIEYINSSIVDYKNPYNVGSAFYQLGIMNLNGEYFEKNEQQAVDYIKKAANLVPFARNYLGTMYEDGIGLLKNPTKAFESYKLASDNGSISAYFNLGRSYLYGIGTATNKTKAAYWFKQAFENGIEDARKIWNENELWKYDED